LLAPYARVICENVCVCVRVCIIYIYIYIYISHTHTHTRQRGGQWHTGKQHGVCNTVLNRVMYHE
jgi:hypothetical protein